MIKTIDLKIPQLENMKKYPENLFYIGNTQLIQTPMVSIVGTRKPNSYTKEFTHKLSSKLSLHGITIVSGAAMGVDAIAHKACQEYRTIAVVVTYNNKLKYTTTNLNIQR
ncbi:DNA-processing protein DprA [Arcobacter roscoffensis]|uniref:DNA-protecting protein DprA n=1 Tax=Arcobacter roscoffensis TaxID=2961520 RepID=A0ABY5E4V4_9BACT|nr:DNA-processing protein DprA [Arcobacter roscoffensis]UTJ06205.1 DNA-protecting protein DprA [Arcobacter roscoffensis]